VIGKGPGNAAFYRLGPAVYFGANNFATIPYLCKLGDVDVRRNATDIQANNAATITIQCAFLLATLAIQPKGVEP
jgi:hypothetical protein